MYKQKIYLVLSALIGGWSFLYSAQMSQSESKMCTIYAPGGPASPHKQKKTVRWTRPQIREVLKGNLFLDPSVSPVYYGFNPLPSGVLYDEFGEKLTFKPNDVLIFSLVMDKGITKDDPEQYDWAASELHGLDRFPLWLPLSLLQGKKEGDTITFLFKNKNQDFVRIKLTLHQLNSRHAQHGDFAKTLSFIKKNFASRPYFSKDDEARLLQAGIIEKYGTAIGEIAYRYGPNGFKG